MRATRIVKRSTIGVGVATLVGLSLVGAGSAQAAVGFNPSAPDARLAGADRYATAALIATKNWPSARTVIVANGETTGIDALSASYLAGAKDAPILLTRAESVPQETAAAIAALNPAEVIVVGGEPSVSPQTYAALTAGRAASSRIAGVDRFDTSAKLVAAGSAALPAGTARPTSVFVARGDVYDGVAADALAASPVAYRAHIPVILAGQGFLSTVSSNALRSTGATNVYVLGSNRSISDAVAQQAATAAGARATTRLQGDDRSGTAVAIANSTAASGAGFGKVVVGLANGFRIDALAAGPAAGKAGYPLLLTESAASLGAATQAYLAANATTLVSAQVFGDTSSIATSVTDQAKSSGGGVPSNGSAVPVVSNPAAQAPANLDAQGDLADVRVTFTLNNPAGPITVQRIASNDPAVVSTVNTTGQNPASGAVIDYDVPAGSWIYRVSVAGSAQTTVANTQLPVVVLGRPAVSGQPTGLTDGQATSVRIVFDQAVSGLAAGEVTTSGSAVFGAPVAVAPSSSRSTTWDVPVIGGSLAVGDTVSVAAGAVSNAVDSTGPVALFTSAPVAPAPTVSGQPTGMSIGSTSVRITFDQAVSGLAPGDVTSNNGSLTLTPSPVSPDAAGFATSWDIAVSGGALTTGNTLTVAPSAVSNSQGSTGPASFTSSPVDPAPAVASRTGMTNGSTAVRLVFNRPVSGLDASEITSSNVGLTFAPTAFNPDGQGFATTWDVAVTGGSLATGDSVVVAAGAVTNAQGSVGPVAPSSATAVPATFSVVMEVATGLSPSGDDDAVVGDEVTLTYSTPVDPSTFTGPLTGITAGGSAISTTLVDGLFAATDYNSSVGGNGIYVDARLSADATVLTLTVTSLYSGPGSAGVEHFVVSTMNPIRPDNALRGANGATPDTTGTAVVGRF